MAIVATGAEPSREHGGGVQAMQRALGLVNLLHGRICLTLALLLHTLLNASQHLRIQQVHFVFRPVPTPRLMTLSASAVRPHCVALVFTYTQYSMFGPPVCFSPAPSGCCGNPLFCLALNTFREPMSKGGLTHTHIAHTRAVIAGLKIARALSLLRKTVLTPAPAEPSRSFTRCRSSLCRLDGVFWLQCQHDLPCWHCRIEFTSPSRACVLHC